MHGRHGDQQNTNKAGKNRERKLADLSEHQPNGCGPVSLDTTGSRKAQQRGEKVNKSAEGADGNRGHPDQQNGWEMGQEVSPGFVDRGRPRADPFFQ